MLYESDYLINGGWGKRKYRERGENLFYFWILNT